ncbi:hypothetical protein Tco_1423758, partial [Tanacetum coccineum]
MIQELSRVLGSIKGYQSHEALDLGSTRKVYATGILLLLLIISFTAANEDLSDARGNLMLLCIEN